MYPVAFGKMPELVAAVAAHKLSPGVANELARFFPSVQQRAIADRAFRAEILRWVRHEKRALRQHKALIRSGRREHPTAAV